MTSFQNMPGFVPPRDRDAWGTIQGYVYQVDLTIERWLDLQPGQILELEHGEDIDLVSRSLTATFEEQERLLEQVKHRDSSITLKNSAAVIAIACFVEHCQNNPEINLLFRYTTNAEVGKERPQMPSRIPGIVAWERIRQGELQGTAQKSVLKGIRTILKSVRQPTKLYSETWQVFNDFIHNASDDQVLELIHRFEWSTKAPKAGSLGSTLQKLLIGKQHAIDQSQAQEQHQRLFLYVFKRLCQPGIKQLTNQERTEQLSLPQLSARDHELLDNVMVWVHALESRVGALEREFSQANEAITFINAQVQYLTKQQGINAAVSYTVTTPILDIPPSIRFLSTRRETVNELLNTLRQNAWVAIYGSVGLGKTQLAILAVQAIGFYCAWIRMRDLTVEQACMRLDIVCQELSASAPRGNRYEWYCQLCEKLGRSAIIVLDDLPRFSNSDELSERLSQLAQACNQHKVHLLSTSAYSVPAGLLAISGLPLQQIEVPPLRDIGVVEILQAYGASLTFSSNFARFINALAQQHPLLVNAIAQYLHRKNWRLTEDALEGLFKSQYTEELNNETIHRLLATIEDSEARELLYRLALIRSDFSLEDVQALAYVNPAITRPPERLNTLLGSWLQSDAKQRLLISPLVQRLGNINLSPDTQQACHLVLGDRITSRHQLSPLDVLQALNHFCAAEAFNRAGSILMVALGTMNVEDRWANDGGLLYIWADQPLPEKIDLSQRILLRGLQISVNKKYERSIEYLTLDFENLVKQAPDSASWAVVGATVSTISVFAQSDPIRANQYLLNALELAPYARLPDGSSLALLENTGLEELIWINTIGVSNTEHLHSWMSTVEQFTNEQRQRAFSVSAAELGCLTLMNNLYRAEKSKPQEQQRWEIIVDSIQGLAERSRHLELELLWGHAVRLQIDILAKHCNNLNAAIDKAETFISYGLNDPRVQLLVGECIGRHYLDACRYSEALFWLNRASNQSTNVYPSIRLDVLLNTSFAVGEQNSYTAIKYMQQAVDLARNSEDILEENLTRSLGSLTIAYWLTGDLVAAFEALDSGCEHLFSIRTDMNDWRELFTRFCYVTVYIVELIHNSFPPQNPLDNQPYPPPQRAYFFNYDSALAAHYHNVPENFLASKLARFAESIEKDDQAAKWAMRGIDMARETGQLFALPVLGENAVPQLLLNNRYAEVLDFALDAGAIFVIHNQNRQEASQTLSNSFNIEEILGSKPNEKWKKAEQHSAVVGIIPIIFRLSTLAINQPDLAYEQAMEVAAICRQIEATAVEKERWTTASELFETIYSKHISSAELINRGNTFAGQDENGFSDSLYILSYIGATLQDGVNLNNALIAHLHTFKCMYPSCRASSSTYRRIVLPFLSTYWTTKFEKMRFRFRSPQFIESELSKVKTLPEHQQLQTIFKTVSLGLSVSLPQRFSQWLQTKS